MQQKLLLNIIPFNPPAGKQTFAFYNQKQEGYFPVFKDDLQGLLDDKFTALELLELQKLYTDFQPPRDGAILLEIDFSVKIGYFELTSFQVEATSRSCDFAFLYNVISI